MTLQVRPFRPTLRSMRAAFLIGCVLVSLAGIQLYLLTGHTDRFFAWTIGVPLTAAFLGAFYFTSLALAFGSASRRLWANARVGVPGVELFLVMTLVTTLLHLSKFHLHQGALVARGAAYLWLFIYAAAPTGLAVVMVLQYRVRGADPPQTDPLPSWLRVGVGVHSAAALGFGVALFAAPTATAKIWPWALTPLTARAMASWLLGLGVVLACAFAENDRRRVRVAFPAYTVLGTLQLVAVARYAGDLDGGAVRIGLYLAVLATMVGIGAYGWVTTPPGEVGPRQGAAADPAADPTAVH